MKIVKIVGNAGSGKTTTLNVLAKALCGEVHQASKVIAEVGGFDEDSDNQRQAVLDLGVLDQSGVIRLFVDDATTVDVSDLVALWGLTFPELYETTFLHIAIKA